MVCSGLCRGPSPCALSCSLSSSAEGIVRLGDEGRMSLSSWGHAPPFGSQGSTTRALSLPPEHLPQTLSNLFLPSILMPPPCGAGQCRCPLPGPVRVTRLLTDLCPPAAAVPSVSSLFLSSQRKGNPQGCQQDAWFLLHSPACSSFSFPCFPFFLSKLTFKLCRNAPHPPLLI